MARQVTIITPENIALTLEEAGLATRFGALFIDLFLQLLAALFGGIAFAILAASVSYFQADSIITALAIVAGFLLFFGYFIFFETLWNGQTPGKRVFGLRVVRDGGYPIDFFASATRNLIRIADFLPMAYLAGALCVFFHPQYKRLGDLVAGTIVIKERMIDPRRAFRTGPVAPAGARFLPETVNNPLEVLDENELALFRRFALRRWEMTADDAERLAWRLLVPRVTRLNFCFTPDERPRYADLVTALVEDADRREAERDAAAAR